MLRFHSNRRRFVLATTTTSVACCCSQQKSFASTTGTSFTFTNGLLLFRSNRSNNNTNTPNMSLSPVVSSSSSLLLFESKRNQIAPADPSMSAKPFVCSMCKKRFRLRDTAQVHLKSAHNGQGEVIEDAAGANGSASPSASSGIPQQQQVNQQRQQQPSTPTPASRFPTQQVTRASAFPTLGKNPGAGGGGPMSPSSGDRDPDVFRREIRHRERGIGEAIYDKETYDTMPNESMKDLMEVWDKFGVQRLGDKFVQYKTAKTVYAALKISEDPTIPSYVTFQAEKENLANPFDAAAAAAASSSAIGGDAENNNSNNNNNNNTPQIETVATAKDDDKKIDIGFAIATIYKSPFICGRIENPLIMYPNPPEKPSVRRKVQLDENGNNNNNNNAASGNAGEDDDEFYSGASSSQSSSGSSNDEMDENSSSTNQQSNNNEDSEISAFAQVMQATSPFSVTESSAPLESGNNAFFAPSSNNNNNNSATVSSPFAQAASSAASPFASFDPSQQQSPFGNQISQAGGFSSASPFQQQQQQQQQQSSSSPFADLIQNSASNQQQQQQQGSATTTTYVAPSTGAPLTPIENAVDLSALFGAPILGNDNQNSSDASQPVTWMCKVCGKNTFTTEAAMIYHAKEKHNVIIAPSGSAGSSTTTTDGRKIQQRKKVRQLPDLPPYIPTPVDLSATAPYGATRQRAATTAFWSEVEVSPHARMMSSATMMGFVEDIIWNNGDGNNDDDEKTHQPSVLGHACLQFTLVMNDEGTNAADERIVVRCFGDDMISLLAPSSSSSASSGEDSRDDGKLKQGCSVFVEGILRLNPSYDQKLNRYQANPAIHVSLPNGFVQRLN